MVEEMMVRVSVMVGIDSGNSGNDNGDGGGGWGCWWR